MKSPEKRLLLIFFLFSIFLRGYSDENLPLTVKGVELCDLVNSQLLKKGIKTSTQPLVSNGLNYFPYNILIENTVDSQENSSLLLYFPMEEAVEHLDCIITITQNLKAESFNSTVLISYGDNFPLTNESTVTGIQTFTSSRNTNTTYYAFIINHAASHNAIISGSDGSVSPSWMVKAAFSAFAQQKITEDIPRYYLSQFSKYTFLHDDILQALFENGVQAIKLNLRKSADCTAFLQQLTENYRNEQKKSSDYHSLMFRIFRHTVWLNEYTIVRSIIITIFLSLLYIFAVGLLNSNLKNVAWKQIKTNWYTIPLTFLLSSGGFFLGKVIYTAFARNGGPGTVYGILILQLLLSSLFVSLFFLLELFFRRTYGERSLDFLIMISSFSNQFIFCLFDMSLFPFFLLQCIIAIFAVILKRNWMHIIMFILMILIFVPYILGLYKLSNLFSLKQFFMNNMIQNLTIPLLLIPFYMMLLRIFTATKKSFSKKRVFLIIVSSTYVFFFVLLFLLNAILFSAKPQKEEALLPKDASGAEISISYSDRIVFSDIIRTINLSFDRQPERVLFYVEDNEKAPVLYSDNDYKTLQQGKAYFTLPPLPPQNMTFTYGTQSTASKIFVELIYLSEDNEYCRCTKELFVNP